MKLKKVLTGSALSLALLVSAAPAFAQTPTSPFNQTTKASVTADDDWRDYIWIEQNSPNFEKRIKVGQDYYYYTGAYNKIGPNTWKGKYVKE
ncbi:hypothetical protein HPX95_05190 [Bacillus tequilensis]|uniref:hypothetical protein n=1 Tax=Bacillus tequilensis TaxID=227866 RepID=UPI001576E6B8|nr:hypothetical protein [Bacillus tequilensis]NTU25576.1 hypothetical protein [Bacillus tequilensis]